MKSRVNWKPCEKCKWQDEACYLVYMLAKGTIKPQINRLEAIHKYSHSPSYYGRFIHNIGSLGTPLPLWNGASLNKKGNGDLLVLLVGPFRLVPDDVNFLGWHKKGTYGSIYDFLPYMISNVHWCIDWGTRKLKPSLHFCSKSMQTLGLEQKGSYVRSQPETNRWLIWKDRCFPISPAK